MVKQTQVLESETTLADLLDRVEAGEELSIERGGQVVARIGPCVAVQDVDGVAADDVLIKSPTNPQEAVKALMLLRKQMVARRRRLGIEPMTIEEIAAEKQAGQHY